MTDRNLMVLLVEDSPRDQRIINRYLDKIDRWDVESVTVPNPDEGLEVLPEQDVDVLLLDHRLGQVNGLKALEEFRTEGYDGPAILTTGTGNERLAGKFIRAGGDDYISKKDLNPELLEESFEFVTNEYEARQERQQRKQELLQQARHDDLTGLFGRRYFMNKLRTCVKDIQNNEAGTFTLLMIDLDNFKDVNDQLGHTVGDTVLESIANAIQSSINNNDIPGRYGGDEFCVLLPEQSQEDALSTAQQLFQSIQSALKEELGSERKNEFGASCSIGIYEYHSEDSINDVIERTDEALMKGKTSGKESITLLTNQGTESIDTGSENGKKPPDPDTENIVSVPQRDLRERFELDPISILLHQDNRTIEAEILDVSDSGLRIVCKDLPNTDEPIEIELNEDRDEVPFESPLTGEIQWIHVEAGLEKRED